MEKYRNPIVEAYMLVQDVINGEKDKTSLVNVLYYLAKALHDQAELYTIIAQHLEQRNN